MKLPEQIQIEKACSCDASRPMLNHVYFQRNADGFHKDRLLATNGVIAAIVPVLASESDVAGYICPASLKASRKSKLESPEFVANGVVKMADGQEFARVDLGRYPNMDAVTPKEETKFSISIDPELLYQLAQAIGSERGVRLEVSGDGKAIRVKPINNPRAKNAKGSQIKFVPACPDALGIIMPIV